MRSRNIQYFQDTLGLCESDSNLRTIPEPVVYRVRIPNYVLPQSRKTEILLQKPEIVVTERDCVVDASMEGERGKILMVNSASALRPGGGVANGSNAQEEHLCRNSNLYLYLEKVDQTVGYPLHAKASGIYCKNVRFFRNPFDFSADVLGVFSTPASKTPDSYGLHLKIWKLIWDVCRDNAIQVLIIPPVGCGVFGHNPSEVARALKTIIDSEPAVPSLKRIVVSCFQNSTNSKAFRQQLRME